MIGGFPSAAVFKLVCDKFVCDLLDTVRVVGTDGDAKSSEQVVPSIVVRFGGHGGTTHDETPPKDAQPAVWSQRIAEASLAPPELRHVQVDVLDAAVEPSMLSTSATAYPSTGKSAGIVNLSAPDDDSLVILGLRPPTSGRAWR